jgi:hypothetical protein
MDDFEKQLKEALSREDAPPWFEARVLAAAEAQAHREAPWWRRWFAQTNMRWATAAAMLVMTAGVWQQHERTVQERAEGEAAKERLKVALRITSTKLHRIQAKVEAIGEAN